ncbi:hypothetical protein [Polyangium sp. 6x1]|uniref:monooxygenase n=1 Tax=Polyangium sp. 6x1 TaxID=3042689 RepID=UPI0024823DF5|nr:hypothetical protein [Polyangium sp. 6x1]MDI1447051.1 hypothetical protein [Polyangium sp. 6x1]
MRTFRLAIPSLLALTSIVGCGGAEDPNETGPTNATEPTYYKDIAPIVNRECAGCHQAGGIGNFSLTDAAIAAQMAPAMAAATHARTMPPMPVNNDGSCQTFENARWLTDEQIALFQSWSKAGAPLGDPADAPPPPEAKGPTLAGDVLQFDLGVDYTPKPPADKPDDYHCFIVDPGIGADVFITGYDIQPGDGRIVHHVALFALPDAQAEADAAVLDAAEEGAGYTCFGGAGTNAVSLVGSWIPGSGASVFPEGTGIRYAAGRKMVVQMHYNVPATGGPFTDRSTMKLQFSKDPALKPALFLSTGAPQISLPPGQEVAEAKGELPLSLLAQYFNLPDFNGIRVWGVLPHMHTAGRTLRSKATTTQGAEQCITDVDRWDFHWQNLWWNETPFDVSADSTISVTCGYDTRGRTETTVMGEGTSDEMCVNVLYATLY